MSRLKYYRKKAGISQEELALSLELTSRYIAFLEKGDRTPSLDVASRIARYFGVAIEDIFLPNKCTESTLNQLKASNE